MNSKYFIVLVIILFVSFMFTVEKTYSENENPCYGQPGNCVWTEWTTLHHISDLKIPELFGDCNLGADINVWWCKIGDIIQYQFQIIQIQPEPTCQCIALFNAYCEGGDDNLKNLWELANLNLGKNLLERYVNDPLYNGIFNCNNPNHVDFQTTQFWAGECSHYCVYQGAGRHAVREAACEQNYCCGILYNYCWDSINNTAVLENKINFGGGETECVITPVGPPCEQVNSEDAIFSSHCYNNCSY